MKIGIIGAGTWGVALSRILTNAGHTVTVWAHSGAERLAQTRSHKNLPGVVLPPETRFTGEIRDCCEGQELVLFAVPSVAVRETAAKAAAFLWDGQILADVAKGIEEKSLMTMSQVIRDELQRHGGPAHCRVVALSGPTHAEEVARDLPTTIVSACEDADAARLVQSIFTGTCVRAYTGSDVLGVELGGAVKNVIALATGIATGLGCGDNARAALITRGLAEMERLGDKMGCMASTFAGLAGMGDLIVTATSEHSRNNRCGRLIGQGVEPGEAVRQVGMVVEGINALPAVKKLMEKYRVEMPISQAAWDVVFCQASPRETFSALMQRTLTAERK